jgi:hypothetical protein
VKLCNIFILHEGGGTRESASIQPEELENVYPDPNRFGAMPAHGFFIRHVQRLDMRDVDIRTVKEDLRPAFVLDDVAGADFVHVKAQLATGTPTLVLKNVKDFSINLSRPIPDLFLDTIELRRL